MNPQFASAGNAAERSGAPTNLVGLYRDPDGRTIGILDEAGADAVVRLGYVLVKEGREAAMAPGSGTAEELEAETKADFNEVVTVEKGK